MYLNNNNTVGDRLFAITSPRLWNTLDWGQDICAIYTSVPTKTEDSFVLAILSGHYTVAYVTGGPW